jgi:DNA-binding HxlR family transcriptional regulator
MSHSADAPSACGMNNMLKTLARAWVADLILILGKSPATRFGALRRSLAGDVSARVLSVRLKELESLGFVSRVDAGTVPMHVEYSLTTAGYQLDSVLRQSEASSTNHGLLELFDGHAR